MSLDIRNLSLILGDTRILNNVSLSVADGERVGLVGSSGSGKSMLLRAATGLLPSSAHITGSCKLGETQTVGASDDLLARLRGKYVGVVFQQANRALNPMLSVEEQISLPLRLHYQLDPQDVHRRVCLMLEKVGLASKLASQRTFELSGGQQQRVGIATALITSPRLILADEPTTALDSVTQRDVVDMLTSLVDDMGASMLFVTHDFSVLSRAAQRCYVLDSGRLVDSADVQDLLKNPQVSSTKQLVEAARKLTLRVTQRDTFGSKSSEKRYENSSETSENNEILLSAKNIHVTLGHEKNRTEILKGVDLSLRVGESLAIIGGSGSGKTTLIRAILGLQKISEGSVSYDGKIVNSAESSADFSAKSSANIRKETAIVFQHPFAALDPRWTVRSSVAEPLNIWKKSLQLDDATINKRVDDVLKLVGLNPNDFAEKYPHELSGGQAQCVAIARALINNPRVLVADEPMSAIDVAERTRILDAFAAIRKDRPKMSCIFVSHDLGMIQHLAERVIVLKEGKIVESGSVADVLDHPQKDYTRALIQASML
ncbi:ABC transporter ATP-binding protein [Gardnerella sp. Marseille-Q2328]|uniref:ABC transporter ATP-binding protein n=1 Tax=Gardnerella sp. Marseille-Q2328 TaxID=2759694 RepID=UPI002025450B|nr:ABC transporter ATP-binding protein [Gardnerella sp. Marseille-Q2328]